MIQKQIDGIPMSDHKTRLEEAIKRIDNRLANETDANKKEKLLKVKQYIEDFLKKHAAHHSM